jgi:hypothetical protein
MAASWACRTSDDLLGLPPPQTARKMSGRVAAQGLLLSAGQT